MAKLLNIGERTLWRYWNSGRVPKPIRIGGALRWNAEKLRQWVETGRPTDAKWAKMRGDVVLSVLSQFPSATGNT